MCKHYTETINVSSLKKQWKRDDVASKIVNFEQAKQKQSQRQFALNQELSRTTLQHWLARKESINASKALVEFLESPVGTAFLHRIITAAHFTFTKDGVASIHNVSNFLKLSGLSPFVASSYTTHQRVSNKMDDLIVEFEGNVQPELAKNMPAKKISLAEDETFHPQICMVSMEPVSNFIVAEKYVQNRDGATWNKVVFQALENLPVEVVQVASDEGRGLINHTIKGLNAHHSSDCFHVPHEIGKGTNGALASAVKKAEKEHDKAIRQIDKQLSIKENYDDRSKRKPGRHPDIEKRIRSAEELEHQARLNLEEARKNQETVRQAKAEIGKVYHPFSTQTGAKQGADKTSELLEECFEKINKATENLSERCKLRVEKAHRVVSNMVATIAFFFSMVDLYMDNIQISDRDRQLMQDYLLPGMYLRQVARKEKDVDRRFQISQVSRHLLSILTQQDGPFSDHTDMEVKNLERAAQECIQLFQRSSSCVEGRNAQLSLRHHGIHRLSDRSLQAQTVVHNYYRRNRDGTTPAERFFEASHPDLFEWLLDKMDYPARPRKRLADAA